MYMGFMKMGFSLMAVFFGMIGLSGFLESSIFGIAAVVVWFYAFFHANNLYAMEDEDFYAMEDHYLFSLDQIAKDVDNKEFVSRYRKIIAAVLIFLGVSVLWNNFLDLLNQFLPEVMREMVFQISYRVPQIVFAIGIIAVGVLMIRGKKKELSEETEEEEDGREEND